VGETVVVVAVGTVVVGGGVGGTVVGGTVVGGTVVGGTVVGGATVVNPDTVALALAVIPATSERAAGLAKGAIVLGGALTATAIGGAR